MQAHIESQYSLNFVYFKSAFCLALKEKGETIQPVKTNPVSMPLNIILYYLDLLFSKMYHRLGKLAYIYLI